MCKYPICNKYDAYQPNLDNSYIFLSVSNHRPLTDGVFWLEIVKDHKMWVCKRIMYNSQIDLCVSFASELN